MDFDYFDRIEIAQIRYDQSLLTDRLLRRIRFRSQNGRFACHCCGDRGRDDVGIANVHKQRADDVTG